MSFKRDICTLKTRLISTMIPFLQRFLPLYMKTSNKVRVWLRILINLPILLNP